MSQQKSAYQPAAATGGAGAYNNANVHVHVPQANVVQATVISAVPAATTMNSQINSQALREFLTSEHNWSPGMQNILINSFAKLPCRFFICDNSGSMMANDGKKIVGRGSQTKLTECTRWKELTDSMNFHARLSDIAFNNSSDSQFSCSNYSQFRVLNAHEPITIGNHRIYGNNIAQMTTVLDENPNGGTPLCKHIRDIITAITAMRADLERNGQRAVLMIATDGESSDGDLAAAMAPLKHLPVLVVVRLCTNQDSIVTYWNNIDENLELDMDVLDDLGGEEEEVRNMNPWLTYGPQIHRLRAFGVSLKEFDLLDEQRLNLDQIHKITRLLLGGERDYPHPDIDMPAFKQRVSDNSVYTYSCYNRRMMPLIQTDCLEGLSVKGLSVKGMNQKRKKIRCS